jgi:hypothetical protein
MQVLSLLGALLVLGAFVQQQRGRWKSDGPAYLWLNLAGAAALTVVAVWDRRVGFVLLESVWAIVSLLSLVKASRPGPAV